MTVIPREIRVSPAFKPRDTFLVDTTARPVSEESKRVVGAFQARWLASSRDELLIFDVPSYSHPGIVEELTERVALMVEGYQELGAFDLELAEADLPASFEALHTDDE